MIDHHAHPFDLEARPLDLRRLAIDVGELQGGGRPPRTAPPLWRALLLSRLAAHLGVEEPDLEAARGERVVDYQGYVRSLFADARISDVVLDPSWPPGSADLLGQFADLSGARIHPLLRVDPVIDEALEQELTFGEVVGRFDAALEAGRTDGVHGLKSIAAYRTGLDVAVVGEADARRSLGDPAPVARRAKPLRDWLFRRMLAFAGEHGLPVQVHTGFGDADLRLAEANPVLLDDVLRSSASQRADVVLLHAGFPFVQEAAFLAASRPTVHVDLSLVNVFAPTAVADTLVRILGLAPPDRVLLGTDGYGLPESIWFAAGILRDAWTEAAYRFRGMGLSASWVDAVGHAVFEGNARALYRL
jgi:uncharacterized protein